MARLDNNCYPRAPKRRVAHATTTGRHSRAGGQMVHRKKYRAARQRKCRRSWDAPGSLSFRLAPKLPGPEKTERAFVLGIGLVPAHLSSGVVEPRTGPASAPCGGHAITHGNSFRNRLMSTFQTSSFSWPRYWPMVAGGRLRYLARKSIFPLRSTLQTAPSVSSRPP